MLLIYREMTPAMSSIRVRSPLANGDDLINRETHLELDSWILLEFPETPMFEERTPAERSIAFYRALNI